MSGVDLDGRHVRKGAADAVRKYVAANGGATPDELQAIVDRIARESVVRTLEALRRHVEQ